MKKQVKRKDLIDMLNSDSGYYKKDLDVVLKSLGNCIMQYFDELNEDGDEIEIYIAEGISLVGKIVPPRNRKDPRNQEDIYCGSTFKPRAIFTPSFRRRVQEQFDAKQKDE